MDRRRRGHDRGGDAKRRRSGSRPPPARPAAPRASSPSRSIRVGNRADEIIKLINEDEDISFLVLAAGSGKEGPGPLVSSLAGKAAASFPVPIVIVPGSLTDEEIDALAG